MTNIMGSKAKMVMIFVLVLSVFVAISANTIPSTSVMESEDDFFNNIVGVDDENFSCVKLGRYCNPKLLRFCCKPYKCGRLSLCSFK